MNCDRYEFEASKLNHSRAMTENERKPAKLRGYICEAYYTHILDSSVRNICFKNYKKIGSIDYAEFLAVARSIGVSPYGEADIKVDAAAEGEVLGDGFDQTKDTIGLLEEILKREMTEQEKVDLYYINGKKYSGAGEEVAVSKEAIIVREAEKMLKMESLLTEEEKDKYGGFLIQTVLEEQIGIDENGEIQYGEFYKMISDVVEGRE